MMGKSTVLPVELYFADAVRELDRRAIEDFAIPGITLMRRAGEAAFRSLRERWPQARRVAVVCGPGNNGGDGLVIARLARQAGLTVTAMLAGSAERLRGDARSAYEELLSAGQEVSAVAPDTLREADVIVDAILGTGLDRAVAGGFARIIDAMNRAAAPKLAVDIPSGLHADSGRILGSCVQADATITFIGVKLGLLTADGPQCAGALYFDDLQVPPGTYDTVDAAAGRIVPDWVRQWLPPRPVSCHKGHFGHVLVVGGDHGYGGAARMAAEAAARVGAGLVSLATRGEHVGAVLSARPEIMCRAVENAAQLDPLLERATVVAVGPGLGQSEWARQCWARVAAADLPLVVDADGLNLLAEAPLRRADWVLTPHPGEAARLLGCSVSEVQANRYQTALAIRDAYGGSCVLKGNGTLIAGDGALPLLCDRGNPGMASGGMGDVLTGAIAGLAAQRLPLFAAAGCGVWLHAAAADRAALDGQRGLLASDLFPHLRRLANDAGATPA